MMRGQLKGRVAHDKGEPKRAKLCCILKNVGAFRFLWVGMKDDSFVKEQPEPSRGDGIPTR